MKKHFIVSQPPLTSKYQMLVDDMSEKRNFGWTNDIDKIEYNKKLLGEEFNMELTIKNMFTDEGISSVFPVGAFITVLQMRKDEKEGKMTFMDYDTDMTEDELRNLLLGVFSENITNSCINVYRVLRENFTKEDDTVELLVPNVDIN